MSPQLLNEWRVVPRLAVLMYGYVCWEVAAWFMALPDPNNAQSVFVSVVWGAAAAWFNFYVNSGNNNVKSDISSSNSSGSRSSRVDRLHTGSEGGEG